MIYLIHCNCPGCNTHRQRGRPGSPPQYVLPHVLWFCQPCLRSSVSFENTHVETAVQVLPLVSTESLCCDEKLIQKHQVLVDFGRCLLPLHHVHVQRLLRPDCHGHRHPGVQVHRAERVSSVRKPEKANICEADSVYLDLWWWCVLFPQETGWQDIRAH